MDTDGFGNFFEWDLSLRTLVGLHAFKAGIMCDYIQVSSPPNPDLHSGAPRPCFHIRDKKKKADKDQPSRGRCGAGTSSTSSTDGVTLTSAPTRSAGPTSSSPSTGTAGYAVSQPPILFHPASTRRSPDCFQSVSAHRTPLGGSHKSSLRQKGIETDHRHCIGACMPRSPLVPAIERMIRRPQVPVHW